MADDIEALNRVRVAMGYDPLPVPGAAETTGPSFKTSKGDAESDEEGPSTVNSRQAAAGSNWEKLEAKRAAEAERQARKDKLKKERERAQLGSKLEGKGLGDVDNDELDTKSWLLQQRKRQKEIEKARKKREEYAERVRLQEEEAEYTTRDLAGVKVGHELEQFDEGAEQILTLKDNAVDDSDAEDELENTILRDREKLEEKLETKKRKRAYDPNEFSENGEQTLLAQYDDADGSKKGKRFTLDGSGSTVEASQRARGDVAGPKGIVVSLDDLQEDIKVSDYAEPVEVKVKKPKKKKSKHSRKKAEDEYDIIPVTNANQNQDADSMDVDGQRKPQLDSNIFDDDDLQAKLAQQRREALKKRKKTRPEDIARQIREEASATPDVMETVEDGESGEAGLVIDETSRFVSNLEKPDTPPPDTKDEEQADTVDTIDDQGDTVMDVEEEHHDDDAREAEQHQRSVSADVGGTGLDDEQTVSRGLASTYSLIKQRGLVENTNGEELNEHHRRRQDFDAQKRRVLKDAEHFAKQQRDLERQSGRLDHMTAKDREDRARNANTSRDLQESRRLAELFTKEYRPLPELKYHDEHGRSLDRKEAFKHLSHQFHGKGSGKGKTEKRLKKIEDENRRMAQSSLDSSQHRAMNYNAGDQAAEQHPKTIK